MSKCKKKLCFEPLRSRGGWRTLVVRPLKKIYFFMCVFPNPVLIPEERFWRPFFVRPKNYIDQEVGEKCVTKVVGNGYCFHTDEFIFVWSFKNGNGRNNAPQVPKLGYFDGGCQNLVKLATSGAGVVCHMYKKCKYHTEDR